MKTAFSGVQTPCYVLDERVLRKNLIILRDIQERTGCHILLALKAFAMFEVFPIIRQYLGGTAASSLFEARLGFEEFGDSVHLCAPAYRETEIEDLLRYCRHVVFNSFSQWTRFKPYVLQADRKIVCGIRINPEHTEVEVPIYDPCRGGSRLGVRLNDFQSEALDGISGIHFHTLCGHNADALERTLQVVEDKFGKFIEEMDWVNFGGGHHITREDYDIELLCTLVSTFKDRYGVEVFLEPGEAVVLNAGVLVASVLDVLPNKIAVLDVSATAHMPDVLEMPYRPDILGAGDLEEHPYTYRLGGPTCLAGDDIGLYSFAEPLEPGSRIVFEDMACYTMVKNTMFNGACLPSIAVQDADFQHIRIIREFGFDDYRNRLS
ncbi:MAG: carboxynorspermidine decarboxylase [Gammaproteobacteria bacterium]|nr:carboxynorspermidine decarboxylase [Gammaproteobacteria bacterium]